MTWKKEEGEDESCWVGELGLAVLMLLLLMMMMMLLLLRLVLQQRRLTSRVGRQRAAI